MKHKTLCLALVLGILLLGHQQTEAAVYSTDATIKGVTAGNFVMLENDETNLLSAPENGEVLDTLDAHTLLRVLSKKGDWLEVEGVSGKGYVFTPSTRTLIYDKLNKEDFSLFFADLNATYDEASLENFLGPVLETNKVKDKTFVDFENYQVAVDKKKYLTEITCRDNELVTNRSAGLGDYEGYVLGQYGAPAVVDFQADKTIYTYYFHPTELLTYSMNFTFNKDSKLTCLEWDVVGKNKRN